MIYNYVTVTLESSSKNKITKMRYNMQFGALNIKLIEALFMIYIDLKD